jgi:toxin ParE1/3/4
MVEHKPPTVWSPEALDDIDHLWDYYAHIAGRATADKIIREIAKIAKTIDDFPYAGRARDEIQAGLRSLTATPQIVFYRLKNDRPEIVRVLDGRQDIEEIFSDDESG